MFMMLLRSSLVFASLWTLIYSSALADPPMGGEVQYFKDPDLDFWKKEEPNTKPASTVANIAKKQLESSPKASGKSQFPWNKYLSPSNDEFFKEGDYTPPAPFMEIARNPSDENIENWFRYLETKNELLRNLQERLNQFAVKHPQLSSANYPTSIPKTIDDEAITKVSARLEKPQPIIKDTKGFRMRLYFDSHCPHCQKMLGTVADLMRMGYWVELKQIDKDTSIRSKIPFTVSDASPDELKRYQIDAVPVLLIGDLKHQTFSKVQGYHSYQEVVSALAK